MPLNPDRSRDAIAAIKNAIDSRIEVLLRDRNKAMAEGRMCAVGDMRERLTELRYIQSIVICESSNQ